MRREPIAKVIIGFIAGAILSGLLSCMDRILIGANPLRLQGYLIATLFGGSSGAIISYLFHTVMTQRHQAQQALRSFETRLNIILSSIGDTVYVFDAEGRFTDCYSGAYDPYPDGKEFLGKRHTETRLPFAGKQFARAFGRASTGEGVEYEFWHESEGADRWYAVKLSPMFVAARFAGAVSVMRDITERKHAEQALEESEEAYRELVEQLPHGLVIAQFDAVRFVLVNPAAAHLLGYTVQELLASSPAEIEALIHPGDRTLFFQRYRDLLAGKLGSARQQARVIRQDGAVRWLELAADHITYRGEPAVRAIVADITGRKQAQAVLRNGKTAGILRRQ